MLKYIPMQHPCNNYNVSVVIIVVDYPELKVSMGTCYEVFGYIPSLIYATNTNVFNLEGREILQPSLTKYPPFEIMGAYYQSIIILMTSLGSRVYVYLLLYSPSKHMLTLNSHLP